MTRLILLAFLLGSAASCASTTLAAAERGLVADLPQHEWRSATASDVPGLYASDEITGPMAAAIWKLYYNFDEDGSYTGAALFAEDPPRFEVLTGTWVFSNGRLSLDGGEAAKTLADSKAIQLSGEAGTVVLRRENEI